MKQIIALIGILLLLFLYLFMFNDRGNKIEYFNEDKLCTECKPVQGPSGVQGVPGPSGQAGPPGWLLDKGIKGHSWKSMNKFMTNFFNSSSGSDILDEVLAKAVKDAMKKDKETTQ